MNIREKIKEYKNNLYHYKEYKKVVQDTAQVKRDYYRYRGYHLPDTDLDYEMLRCLSECEKIIFTTPKYIKILSWFY